MARDPYWPREFPIEIRDTHPEYPSAVARQYLCREFEDFQQFQGSEQRLVRCIEALIDCRIALALAAK